MPKTYMLKTINADFSAYGGFEWPESGYVKCHDWDETPMCGGGLHGALMGSGDGSLFCWKEDAIWLVLEIDSETIVDLGGKVKVPYCDVIYSGDRKTATDMIIGFGGKAVIGSIVTGGDYSTVTGGDKSTVTGGYESTVTGGNGSTATGGNYSTVTGGNGSTVTGGNYSTVTGGNYSTVTGGNGSTVTGGYESTVTGGNGSLLNVYYYDEDKDRRRCVVGYVGEDGIEPNVPYHVVNGKLVIR